MSRTIYALLFLSALTVAAFAQDAPVYSSKTDGRDSIPFFILVGDTQFHFPPQFYERDNRKILRPLLKRIADEHPAFTIMLGDLVLWGSDEKEWRRFDAFVKPLRMNATPVLPLFGNHEYMLDPKSVMLYFYSRFPDLDGNSWYAQKYRNIGIIILNSNFDKLSHEDIQEQDSWYKKVLQIMESDTSFSSIIVCDHHPAYTNSTVISDDEQVQQHFVEPFKRAAKTKIFFSGHCHSYEHFQFGDKHFVVSGGAGPTQKLKQPTSNLKQDLYKGGEWRDHHYCKVIAKNEGLLVEVVMLNEETPTWSIGDSFLVK